MEKIQEKVLVACHGQSEQLTEFFKRAVPTKRQCELASAHVVLHDCGDEACRQRHHHPHALHIVIAERYPIDLHPGLFWIRPGRENEIGFTTMIRTLNPGCD